MEPPRTGQSATVVLSNEVFDWVVAWFDEPARPVDEMVELFGRHPKLREE